MVDKGKKHKIKGYPQHRDALSGPTQRHTETKYLVINIQPRQVMQFIL